MPTYQYACTECGHQFETVQSFSDASLTECPQCTGKLRKVFNAVGIVFKGSGFYRTDSRSGSGTKDSSSSESGTAAKDGAGSSAKDSGSSTTSSTSSGSSSSSSSGGSSSAAGASTSSGSSTKGSAA